MYNMIPYHDDKSKRKRKKAITSQRSENHPPQSPLLLGWLSHDPLDAGESRAPQGSPVQTSSPSTLCMGLFPPASLILAPVATPLAGVPVLVPESEPEPAGLLVSLGTSPNSLPKPKRSNGSQPQPLCPE